MAKSKEQPDKDRKWRLLLYPDSEAHLDAMKTLEEGGYKYCAILHDKDVYEDGEEGKEGELKKPHWHVVVRFQNGIFRNSLAKQLGITPNFIQDCNNFDKSCLYLLHATKDSDNKYQYDTDELFGPLAPHVVKLVSNEDEGERVLKIVSELDSRPGRMSYRDLLVWSCKHGLYGEFRRLGSGVKYLLDEHNADIDTQ